MLPIRVATATRTLLAAGYEVTDCQRHPQYAEIQCERISKLGPMIRYTFAITDNDAFTLEQIDDIVVIAVEFPVGT